MKTMVRLPRAALFAICVASTASAAETAVPPQGWAGLERRISQQQALAVLHPTEGSPLLVTRSRDRRFEVWNYDRGGWLIFVGGMLDYWVKPRPGTAAAPVPDSLG